MNFKKVSDELRTYFIYIVKNVKKFKKKIRVVIKLFYSYLILVLRSPVKILRRTTYDILVF